MITKSRSFAVLASGLMAITGLTLSALALPPAAASAPVQAAMEGTAASGSNAPAVRKTLPADLPGGKSVVGDTSPIHDPALIIADDGTWYVYSTGLVNREN